jgi:hypothetical protein
LKSLAPGLFIEGISKFRPLEQRKIDAVFERIGKTIHNYENLHITDQWISIGKYEAGDHDRTFFAVVLDAESIEPDVIFDLNEELEKLHVFLVDIQ